jgi:superfamily II DNA/RNA helicase
MPSAGWTKFSESPLNPWLKRHLASVNIERPSPIQLQLIKTIMSPEGKRIRKNVFGCSPTGTGKTLAYVLPMLHFLTQDIRPYYALILAPTRELAFQIYEIIKVLTGSTAKDGSSTMIKTLLMIGGGKTGLQSNETEIQGFWSGKPNIVVATPGRMVEQLTRKNFSDHTGHRSALRFDFLILDEADLLIGPTFANQLKEILEAIDEHGSGNNRQTLVLSATLTSALEQLQSMFSSNDDDALKPVTINLLPTIDEMKLEISSNPNLDQRYIVCPEAMKPAYLVQALSDISFKQTIVFCSSTRQAMLLHKLMINLGFDEAEVKCHPVLLVGSKDQRERLKALEKFKSVKSRIMIATGGLAGRGLDLPQVDLVIQYNCPTNPVDYIHRVGRTCRKIDFARIDEIEKIRANVRALKSRQSKPDTEQQDNQTDVNSVKRVEKDSIVSDNKDAAMVTSDNNSAEQRGDNNGATVADKTVCKLDHPSGKESEIDGKTTEELEPKTKRSKLSKAATKYYGKAILFITQYDIDVLKNIEKFVNIRLTEEDEVDTKNITNILKPVAIALKDAELSLIEEQKDHKK